MRFVSLRSLNDRNGLRSLNDRNGLRSLKHRNGLRSLNDRGTEDVHGAPGRAGADPQDRSAQRRRLEILLREVLARRADEQLVAIRARKGDRRHVRRRHRDAREDLAVRRPAEHLAPAVHAVPEPSVGVEGEPVGGVPDQERLQLAERIGTRGIRPAVHRLRRGVGDVHLACVVRPLEPVGHPESPEQHVEPAVGVDEIQTGIGVAHGDVHRADHEPPVRVDLALVEPDAAMGMRHARGLIHHGAAGPEQHDAILQRRDEAPALRGLHGAHRHRERDDDVVRAVHRTVEVAAVQGSGGDVHPHDLARAVIPEDALHEHRPQRSEHLDLTPDLSGHRAPPRG